MLLSLLLGNVYDDGGGGGGGVRVAKSDVGEVFC